MKADKYMKGPTGKTVTQLYSDITWHWFLRKILRPLGSYGRQLNGRQAASSPPSTGA